ncbi:unnamed protein product [Sphagnum balticum]
MIQPLEEMPIVSVVLQQGLVCLHRINFLNLLIGKRIFALLKQRLTLHPPHFSEGFGSSGKPRRTLASHQFILLLFVGFDKLESGIVFLGKWDVALLERRLYFLVYGVIALLDTQVKRVLEDVPTVVLDEVLEDVIESAFISPSAFKVLDLVEEDGAIRHLLSVHQVLIG